MNRFWNSVASTPWAALKSCGLVFAFCLTLTPRSADAQQGSASPAYPQQQQQPAQAYPQTAGAGPVAQPGAQPVAQPLPQPVQAAYPAYAEEPERRANTIFVEGLGPGLWYSFNFERLVIPDLAVRLGFSYLSLSAFAGSSSASATYLNFPLTASYLGLGSRHHIFEVGGGVTFNYTSAAVSSGFSSASGAGVTVFGNVFAGYRLHPVGRPGFNFRAGVNAIIARGISFGSDDPEAIGVLPLPYMSAGVSF